MLRAVSVAGATPIMTYYFGPFVHEGTQGGTSSLKYILTPEGRILNVGTDLAPVWKLEYDLKDHLGNVRVVVTPHATPGYATLLQENNYYPFGMRMSEICTNSASCKNQYKYNGKELQPDFGLNWYDYGARFYDPSLGRWHSVDPLAEMYSSFSPYNYSLNNPISFKDPNGMWVDKGDRYSTDDPEEIATFMGQYRNGPQKDNNQSPDIDTGIPTSVGELFEQIGESLGNFLGLGLKNEIGSSDFDKKKTQASQNREMTLLAIETANGIMSVLVPASSVADVMSKIESGHGLAVLSTLPLAIIDFVPGGKGAETFFEGAKYSQKVLRQMDNASDIFHAFPKSVDGFATKFGKWSTKVGNDGKTYQWLELSGSYKGKSGTFEFIRDADGVINHRFFNVKL